MRTAMRLRSLLWCVCACAYCGWHVRGGVYARRACRKLNETPFPFPWAQGITVVLIIFTLTVPYVFTSFINNTVVAATASAIAVCTYIMMNEVANDIEDPFHYDPNQLPLPQMQYRLNERLLAVSKTERPLAFTDFGALLGPRNFPQLPVRPSHLLLLLPPSHQRLLRCLSLPDAALLSLPCCCCPAVAALLLLPR
jgi:hypothetical protein